MKKGVTTMTIDEMKKRKIEMGLTNEDLSIRSGVPAGTINKIFSGETKAPRKNTVAALEAALCPPACKAPETSYGVYPGWHVFAEADAPYQAGTNPIKKRPGEYTLDDYLALPDDVRVELIDGYFYDMASPHFTHQAIASQIGHQLLGYVDRKGGPCMVTSAPIDVQIDKNEWTVLQPDVTITCDPRNYVKNGRGFGAPDLVIEILSPSTRKRDLTLKLTKYSEAGVRELWYVDPQDRKIMVYDLENDIFPKTYSFEDEVPVLIWSSDFSVDFKKVLAYLEKGGCI